MGRKDYVMKRLLELTFKERLDSVDMAEEKRLMEELEEIEQREGEINGYNTIVNRILIFIKDVQDKENTNAEKSITAAQFCLLKAAMCENFSACGNCPIGKTRDDQDVNLSCDKFSMKKPEMTIRFVQEWAVRNGFLTEDLEETDNYRNLVMRAQNEGGKG